MNTIKIDEGPDRFHKLRELLDFARRNDWFESSTLSIISNTRGGFRSEQAGKADVLLIHRGDEDVDFEAAVDAAYAHYTSIRSKDRE